MRNKYYICYETEQIMSLAEWEAYYNKNIDKMEYPDFNAWLYDMLKSGVLEESEEEPIKTIKKGNETALIFRHDANDFSIYYNNADYSLRGTLEEIKEDYKEHFEEELEF